MTQEDEGKPGEHPSLSADGLRLVFEYQGAIWLRDRSTGTFTRVDSTAAGPANDVSGSPSISADGSVVAFLSHATNLVPGDTNGQTDVFVRVVASGAIERVSVRSDGTQGSTTNGGEYAVDHIALSSDGRYVAFETALRLVASDTTDSSRDIYVRDRVNHTTNRESFTSGGATADGDSLWPTISGDGRYLAFTTAASNIVSRGSAAQVVVLRDRFTGTTRVGSADASGIAREGYAPSLSQDGRYLAFLSPVAFLPDAGPGTKVYERDLTTGTVYLAGASEGPTGGIRSVFGPDRTDISADGRFVHWSRFNSGDTNYLPGVRIYDRLYGITTTILATDSSNESAMSGDGLHFAVAHPSLLVLDRSGNRAPVITARDVSTPADRDTPSVAHIRPQEMWSAASDPDGDPLVIRVAPLGPFPLGTTTVTVSAYDGLVMSQATAHVTVNANSAPASPVQLTTVRVSLNSAGGQGDGPSNQPWPSRDGRVVAFASQATTLDPAIEDFNTTDVFVRDTGAPSTTPVFDDADLNVYNVFPRVSDDGRYMVFDYTTSGGYSPMRFDRSTGTVNLLLSGGAGAVGGISRNGRFIVYSGSNASGSNAMMLDQSTGTVTNLPQLLGWSPGYGVAISDDGRYLAFTANGRLQILDRQTGSVTTPPIATVWYDYQNLSMSLDGRYIAVATNVLNATDDVVIWDRVAGIASRPIHGLAGVAPNGANRQPSLSADGRYLAFVSDASNLVPDDSNAVADVFRLDLTSGRLLRVSLGAGEANGASVDAHISGDGTTVVYSSDADDLVVGDTNGVADVFATRIVEQGSQPFGGTPRAVPGRIYARDYDSGGEGVAYHDTDAANTGGQYRPSEGVDLSTSSAAGDVYLAATNAGEWMKFTISVSSAGSYTISGRITSPFSSGRFHLENDAGVTLGGPWAVTNTGGWQNWQVQSFGTIQLPAGTQTLRLVIDGGGFNLDYLDQVATTTGGSFATKINFQPATAPTVAGYLVDAGALYGPRNGQTYGWNAAVDTRDRNASSDQRLDTLALMQSSANPNARWELAVPNGTYSVHVVCGDPSYFDGNFDLLVEGVVAVTGRATSTSPFHEGTVTVQVTDGRLTLTNGFGSYNTKICYIEVQQVPTGNG